LEVVLNKGVLSKEIYLYFFYKNLKTNYLNVKVMSSW